MAKRGDNVYKRKDDRWEGRFFVNNQGEKKCVSVYGNSRKEVKEKRTIRWAEFLIASRTPLAPPATTEPCIAFEQAADEWLADEKPRVKESTYRHYEYLLNKQILPWLGDKDMRRLDVAVLKNFMRERSENGRLKSEGGISNKYLQDIVSVVKGVANLCEQDHDIPSKIRHVKTPKVEHKERKMLTPEEQKRLTRCLMSQTSRDKLGMLMGMYIGPRLGEVCGLRSGDFDSAEGTIAIRRTVQRIPDNKGGTKLNVGTPKTKSSERTIPLPPQLCELMSKFKGEDNEYILTGSETVPEPAKLRRKFKSILKECGLGDIRFHDLRHIFASNCVQMNFDVKSLSEILGHSNTSTTLNRYVHTTLEIKRHYMNMIKMI